MNPELDPAEVAAAYASDKVLARIARDRANHERNEMLRLANQRAEVATKEAAIKELEKQQRITVGLICNARKSLKWAKKRLKPSSPVPTRLRLQTTRRKRRIRDIIIKRKQRELKTSISRQWYEGDNNTALIGCTKGAGPARATEPHQCARGVANPNAAKSSKLGD